jgi:preprotein translocase subunit SecD
LDFELSRRGGRIFERETGRRVNAYLVIILDGQVQGQPPIIRGPISRWGQIELGSKPLAQAQDLAVILRAGPLPAPLVLVDEQVLGPSSSGGRIESWVPWAAAAAVVLWGVMVFALSRRRATPQ